MKLAILDRDGVINENSPDYIKSPEEWYPLPGSLEAIARLKRAGWRVAVATNQSAIGRGLITQATLEAIHASMARALEAHGGRIDVLAYCPHTPDDHCDCRKPASGLLREISTRLGTGLAGVPFIGDNSSDVLAARAVGARPILVRTGYGEATAAEYPDVPVFDDLAAAVNSLLSTERER